MAVTARIGGIDGGGAMQWVIEYDDATRAVTTTASGTNGQNASGYLYVTVQIASTISRTVAYYPPAGGESQDPDLAQRMRAADFTVTADGTLVTLASGIPPAQVRRLLGKATATIGGLHSESVWSRS